MNLIPSNAPSSVIERTARTMKNMNNIGIIHLLAFSIPFFTPPSTIQIVKIINNDYFSQILGKSSENMAIKGLACAGKLE